MVSLGHDKNEISVDFHRNTPVHLAAQQNHQQTMHFLIQHSSKSLEFQNDQFHTPLIEAVINNNDEAMSLCIHVGAELNIMDHNGDTPLHLASMYGQKKCLKMLINNDAKTDVLNNRHFKPIDVAKTDEVVQYIKALIKERNEAKRLTTSSTTTFNINGFERRSKRNISIDSDYSFLKEDYSESLQNSRTFLSSLGNSRKSSLRNDSIPDFKYWNNNESPNISVHSFETTNLPVASDNSTNGLSAVNISPIKPSSITNNNNSNMSQTPSTPNFPNFPSFTSINKSTGNSSTRNGTFTSETARTRSASSPSSTPTSSPQAITKKSAIVTIGAKQRSYSTGVSSPSRALNYNSSSDTSVYLNHSPVQSHSIRSSSSSVNLNKGFNVSSPILEKDEPFGSESPVSFNESETSIDHQQQIQTQPQHQHQNQNQNQNTYKRRISSPPATPVTPISQINIRSSRSESDSNVNKYQSQNGNASESNPLSRISMPKRLTTRSYSNSDSAANVDTNNTHDSSLYKQQNNSYSNVPYSNQGNNNSNNKNGYNHGHIPSSISSMSSVLTSDSNFSTSTTLSKNRTPPTVESQTPSTRGNTYQGSNINLDYQKGNVFPRPPITPATEYPIKKQLPTPTPIPLTLTSSNIYPVGRRYSPIHDTFVNVINSPDTTTSRSSSNSNVTVSTVTYPRIDHERNRSTSSTVSQVPITGRSRNSRYSSPIIPTFSNYDRDSQQRGGRESIDILNNPKSRSRSRSPVKSFTFPKTLRENKGNKIKDDSSSFSSSYKFKSRKGFFGSGIIDEAMSKLHIDKRR